MRSLMLESISRLRASHFSLLVQRKVTKRKHTRAAPPPLRYGCASATGIPGSSILLLRKRRTSLCTALRVYPIALAAPHGARGAQNNSGIKSIEAAR